MMSTENISWGGGIFAAVRQAYPSYCRGTDIFRGTVSHIGMVYQEELPGLG